MYDDGPIQVTSLLRRLPFLSRRVLAALSLDEAQPFDLLLPTAGSPEGHCLEVSLDHDCLKPGGTCLAESPFGCLDQSTPKTTARTLSPFLNISDGWLIRFVHEKSET